MDENLEEEEILSVISKRLDADLRVNIQTNKRRIFEEKSSLHASNPIVSPIISRCSAHTHTHTQSRSCAQNALQAWSATIWQGEIFIQPGR